MPDVKPLLMNYWMRPMLIASQRDFERANNRKVRWPGIDQRYSAVFRIAVEKAVGPDERETPPRRPCLGERLREPPPPESGRACRRESSVCALDLLARIRAAKPLFL